MSRLLTALLAMLALAVFATGCGDDEDDGGAATGTTPPAQTTTPTAAHTGTTGSTAIAMKGIRFQPQDVTVKVGTEITWTNEDPVEHDAVDQKTGKFKSELFGQGKTFSYTAHEAGSIEYVCSVHPGMTGTITVEE